MDLTIRVQILDEVTCIPHRIIPMKNCSLSRYEWIVGQAELFKLGMETNLGKGKLWIQTC